MGIPPKVNSDLAGWWFVNHANPKDQHAVIDPCPMHDPQCRLDRQAVRHIEARKAVAYTVDMLDGYGDEEPS